MLRRLLALLAMLGASLVIVTAVAPAATAGCVVDKETGEVVCEDKDDGNNGGGNDNTGGASTCTYAGKEIPCTGPDGSVWSSKYRCWIGARGPNNLVPPEGQTKEDGWWHVCYFPPPGSSFEYMWIETGEVGIDPVVLANRAIASMDLDPIEIGIVPESGPDQVGLVGLPVWMWVDNPTDDTYGPITASASEGAVSVSVSASVSSVVWDMGDGSRVNCIGEGTPYADRYGTKDSPTCGHRYEKMSFREPGGVYGVTATSHWVVEWVGGGQTGTIEFDLTTEPAPIRIGEAQVLTQ
jgi:hypothetical protein